MSQSVCWTLQLMLKANPLYFRDFLQYQTLQELFRALFINSTLENCQHHDAQNVFIPFLTDEIEILKIASSEDRKLGSRLFQILLEEMIFMALRSQCVAYVILQFIGDNILKHDLRQQFDCDINVFDIMKELVDYIKRQEPIGNNLHEIKVELCFYILCQYLQTNPNKIYYFGQNLNLVEEILSRGIFKVPTLERGPRSKYNTKGIMKKALDMLSLLSKNEKNFSDVITFLLPIHKTGIWRNNKPSSWSLSATIKKRSHRYSGLKNLGCSKF